MNEHDQATEFARAFSEGRLVLPQFDDEMWQLCARVNLVCVVSPDLDYPPMDGQGIEAFLVGAFADSEDESAVRGLHLRDAFREFAGETKFGWLNEIVPPELKLPNGEVATMLYSMETEPRRGEAIPPEVWIQPETIRDWDFHPYICEGLVAVKIVLCDSRQRRISETFDWPTFKRENC